jgi:hypothetical protein
LRIARTPIIQSRIADQLGIQDGDEIEYELVEFGERFRNQVTVKEDMDADFVVRLNAGLMGQSCSMGPDTTASVTLCSSGKGCIAHTTLWAGMKFCGLEALDFCTLMEKVVTTKGAAGGTGIG